MKNYKLLILLMSLLISFSCGDDFGDYNLDPTRPGGENVPPIAIIPIMQTQTHRNIVSAAGRIAGIFTQQYEGFDAQQVAFTQYALDEGTLANFWEFGLYTGSMRDCADIIERADNAGDLALTKAIAQIYMAANLGIATNLWGDVPYTEAFQGEANLAPSYDSQQDIYNTIIALLDDALVNIATGQEAPTGTLVELAETEDWASVAQALKARFYLQQSKRDSNAYSNALSAISSAITDNEQNPVFEFEDNSNGGNPLALFGIQRPNTLVIAPFFDNITNGDPRKDYYLYYDDGGTPLYYIDPDEYPDLFWSQLDSPSLLISYAEVKFIEAEAQLMTGAASATVLQTLHEAIAANMEYLDISEADVTNYIATVTSSDLETIITEKYKALFGSNPIQVWNDYRRTGFPNITPNAEGANGSNPSGIVPRRILYPDSERLSNTEAYEAAIANQGGHLMDVDMWVFE